MTIHARQIALAQRLFSLKKEEYIEYLEQVFDSLEQEEQLPPLTTKEIEGIKEALQQVKKGEVYSDEEIKKQFFNGQSNH